MPFQQTGKYPEEYFKEEEGGSKKFFHPELFPEEPKKEEDDDKKKKGKKGKKGGKEKKAKKEKKGKGKKDKKKDAEEEKKPEGPIKIPLSYAIHPMMKWFVSLTTHKHSSSHMDVLSLSLLINTYTLSHCLLFSLSASSTTPMCGNRFPSRRIPPSNQSVPSSAKRSSPSWKRRCANRSTSS